MKLCLEYDEICEAVKVYLELNGVHINDAEINIYDEEGQMVEGYSVQMDLEICLPDKEKTKDG
jgi:hypothetical protein